MDFSKIVLAIIISGSSFIASFAVIRYQVTKLTEDLKAANNRIDVEGSKRDDLKDYLIQSIHDISIKLTEVHTIVTKK
jgi:hypothetical protein